MLCEEDTRSHSTGSLRDYLNDEGQHGDDEAGDDAGVGKGEEEAGGRCNRPGDQP